MYRIAVCDDNRDMLNEVSGRIRSYCEKHEIGITLMEFFNSGQLAELIDNNRLFDVYFLDIEMPEYTGIEITKRIREHSTTPFVIYVTAYDKYAVDACHMDIFWYLCKNRLGSEMNQMLDKLFFSLEGRMKDQVYVINNKRKYLSIYYKDIIYARKNQKNIELILAGDRKIQERITLQEAYLKLKKRMIFVDRGLLLNPMHIQAIEENCIKVEGGYSFAVNSTRVPEIKRTLDRYWQTMSSQQWRN